MIGEYRDSRIQMQEHEILPPIKNPPYGCSEVRYICIKCEKKQIKKGVKVCKKCRRKHAVQKDKS